MIQPTLLFGAAMAILSAAIYFYVGRVLSRRRVASPDARLAWTLFVVWWYALACSTLSGALISLLGAFNLAGVALFVTFNHVNLLALCVALFGLMYYLLYLFTGSRRLLWPLAIFYILYYMSLIYFVQARVPIGVTVGRWNAGLEFQREPTGPLFLVLLLLLIFPQVIGSLAYFTLYFRVRTVTQKYRILLVSWSIIIWFSSAFLASIAGLSSQDWWQVTSRLIGLAAALAILLAYDPVPWIRRRLGVNSIAEEPA
ncbi:MAG TPA: hypothetical protein VK900_07635 [Anaerolineales bacterium]|nr:hypothetical protein [Anaerolineales bacterium]